MVVGRFINVPLLVDLYQFKITDKSAWKLSFDSSMDNFGLWSNGRNSDLWTSAVLSKLFRCMFIAITENSQVKTCLWLLAVTRMFWNLEPLSVLWERGTSHTAPTLYVPSWWIRATRCRRTTTHCYRSRRKLSVNFSMVRQSGIFRNSANLMEQLFLYPVICLIIIETDSVSKFKCQFTCFTDRKLCWPSVLKYK